MPDTASNRPRYLARPNARGDRYAYTRVDGRMVSLGRYGTGESYEQYERVVAEWEAAEAERAVVDRQHLTVAELGEKYLECELARADAGLIDRQTYRAARDGGAIYCLKISSPTLTDCYFCGNLDGSGFNSISGEATDGRSSGNNQLEAPCVVGDHNFDGEYDEDDAADFVAVRNQVGVKALGCLVADIDGDGEVDGAVFAYILGYWGLCSAP